MVEASRDVLRGLPNSDQAMTVVILEHQKFLQTRSAFQAERTKLAFSNLAIRRIYLSSHVFTDFATTLRCVPHELGHFAIRDAFEDHAELAAQRIRKRVQQTCSADSRF